MQYAQSTGTIQESSFNFKNIHKRSSHTVSCHNPSLFVFIRLYPSLFVLIRFYSWFWSTFKNLNFSWNCGHLWKKVFINPSEAHRSQQKMLFFQESFSWIFSRSRYPTFGTIFFGCRGVQIKWNIPNESWIMRKWRSLV